MVGMEQDVNKNPWEDKGERSLFCLAVLEEAFTEDGTFLLSVLKNEIGGMCPWQGGDKGWEQRRTKEENGLTAKSR